MADISVRYVMILGIEKIVTQTHSIYDNSLKRNVDVEASSKKTEVTKIIINDPDINRLLDRATKHIALIHDEETE